MTAPYLIDPTKLASTRQTLHRIAAHVLGRRRHEVTGRFGLRASPGGFATPAFGEGPEAVRLAGSILVHELGGKVTYHAIAGRTLRELATFAGADLTAPFSSGAETPALGDVDAVLDLDGAVAGMLSEWIGIGWQVLDQVLAALPSVAAPDVIQLWPEHFDVGSSAGLQGGSRVNLGASLGDHYLDQPYLYVAPWETERPGDSGFWNVPFGAALRRSEVLERGDPLEVGAGFLRTGLRLLTAEP